MDKRSTVDAAINHQSTDEVPFCISFARDAQQSYGEQLAERYLTDHMRAAVTGGLLSVDEAIKLSIGNHVYLCNDKPWWGWHDVPDDFRNSLEAPSYVPGTRGFGSYERLAEKIRFVKESTGSYVLVLIYGSHFEKANACRGFEHFLGDLAGDKAFAKRLLDTIIRKNMVMLENLVTIADIDGFLLGSDWGSQESLLMSPDTWRDLIAPGEYLEYQLIKDAGKHVWVHSCGNIELVIPDLIDMGLDVLNPLQPECMDIYRIKDTYGSKLSFWGGISTQQTLPYGSPEDVRAETRAVISYLSRDGGYIASPAQEIQADVPLENVHALIDELRHPG